MMNTAAPQTQIMPKGCFACTEVQLVQLANPHTADLPTDNCRSPYKRHYNCRLHILTTRRKLHIWGPNNIPATSQPAKTANSRLQWTSSHLRQQEVQLKWPSLSRLLYTNNYCKMGWLWKLSFLPFASSGSRLSELNIDFMMWMCYSRMITRSMGISFNYHDLPVFIWTY